jgi:hypothetical protein
MFVLGKIAFELLIQYRGSQVAFGRHVLRGHAIDDKIVSALLNTGLLLEENCFDPTSEKNAVFFCSYLLSGVLRCSLYYE